MKTANIFFAFTVLLLSACSAIQKNGQNPTQANSQESIVISGVRKEIFLYHPEKAVQNIINSQAVKNTADIIDDGIYKSPYQGYSLKIPPIFGKTKMSVHYALVSHQSDGTPITSHVKFISDKGHDVMGVVVTMLREDRSKDPQSVLNKFLPANKGQQDALEQIGATYHTYTHDDLLILQRSIKNRIYTADYPYTVSQQKSDSVKSFGISRYMVKGDYFYEFFALILNETSLNGEKSLLAAADKQLDLLMSQMHTYAN